MKDSIFADMLHHYQAVVAAVHDGRTLTINIDLGFNVWHSTHVILQGIEVPPIQGKTTEDRKLGCAAQEFLIKLVRKRKVFIHVKKRSRIEPYSWLIDMFYEKETEEEGTYQLIHVNKVMVDRGLATVLE